MKTGVALAIVVGIGVGVGIGACAGTRQVGGLDQRADRKNEITALWTQIRDWRREAGMDVEPGHETVKLVRGQSADSVRRARLCPDTPPPPACNDVCSIADAICDNAESICGIAAELDGDPWAADKCTSAKASCREAKQRCCSCNPG